MFEELSSPIAKVKYAAAKELLNTAEKDPATLYPHFDFFTSLLTSKNNVLKWTAIDIVGHLSAVDGGKRAGEMLPLLYGFLHAGKLITANHAISALGHIARAVPEHRPAITAELLKVEDYVYETDECRNIALGCVLTSIAGYASESDDRLEVVAMAQRQTRNSRNATAKKAEAFLKKCCAGTRRANQA